MRARLALRRRMKDPRAERGLVGEAAVPAAATTGSPSMGRGRRGRRGGLSGRERGGRRGSRTADSTVRRAGFAVCRGGPRCLLRLPSTLRHISTPDDRVCRGCRLLTRNLGRKHRFSLSFAVDKHAHLPAHPLAHPPASPSAHFSPNFMKPTIMPRRKAESLEGEA